MEKVIISVDLGGTKIRAAQMDRNLHILERKETLTLAQEGLEASLGRIKQMIREVFPEDRTRVEGIGISAPGPLNPTTGVVVAPPNLPGWHNVPLAEILEAEFSVPVYVGNDANVAVLAEYLRGAARGDYRHIIFLTISTGVGSGMIVDGRLLLGRNGLAAEAGHMPIVVDGGRVSTVEEESAGPDMAAKARQRIEAGESSMMRDMVGGELARLDGATVGRAALQGDSMALEIVAHSGRVMGLGIVTLLHLFNPEIVVIGGGVSNLGDLLFDPIREMVEKYARDAEYYRDMPIVKAELGDDVSLIGAGALVVTKGGVMDVAQVGRKLST